METLQGDKWGFTFGLNMHRKEEVIIAVGGGKIRPPGICALSLTEKHEPGKTPILFPKRLSMKFTMPAEPCCGESLGSAGVCRYFAAIRFGFRCLRPIGIITDIPGTRAVRALCPENDGITLLLSILLY